jgi:alpha-ketoglutarate-dependent taurine dioxygenase
MASRRSSCIRRGCVCCSATVSTPTSTIAGCGNNCDCDRHPRTHERTLCSSELPDDLAPRTATLRGDVLEIEWSPDGHRSTYPRASLADALAAFRHLEASDAHAAELLTSVPVRFHRKQQCFEREIVAPMITRDGDRFQVRCSYFTLAPHVLPFARMLDFYRAHDSFIRLVRDPRHHRRVRLEPGDWLLHDNHRTLHARTRFTGARWVRGIYFDV